MTDLMPMSWPYAGKNAKQRRWIRYHIPRRHVAMQVVVNETKLVMPYLPKNFKYRAQALEAVAEIEQIAYRLATRKVWSAKNEKLDQILSLLSVPYYLDYPRRGRKLTITNMVTGVLKRLIYSAHRYVCKRFPEHSDPKPGLLIDARLTNTLRFCFLEAAYVWQYAGATKAERAIANGTDLEARKEFWMRDLELQKQALRTRWYCRIPKWSPTWHTVTTIALASQMYHDNTWNLGPILADALMDAGCEHDTILALCNGVVGLHRGIWFIDKLRGAIRT